MALPFSSVRASIAARASPLAAEDAPTVRNSLTASRTNWTNDSLSAFTNAALAASRASAHFHTWRIAKTAPTMVANSGAEFQRAIQSSGDTTFHTPPPHAHADNFGALFDMRRRVYHLAWYGAPALYSPGNQKIKKAGIVCGLNRRSPPKQAIYVVTLVDSGPTSKAPAVAVQLYRGLAPCSGCKNRTCDLLVMSQTSYRCSNPLC